MTEEENGLFVIRPDGGECYCCWNDCAHLNGGNWTRVEIPEEPEYHIRFAPGWTAVGDGPRRKWFVVPDYQPNGTPATTAHVVDGAGQEVATFERIADAEAAVAAVNNATGEAQ